mgnify:CR=1 FL=1
MRSMNESLLYNELIRLRSQVNYHNYRYHVLDAPIISDLDYDRLVLRLREIEGEHPEWITPDSPTQRTGGAILEKFAKIQHPAPILSLAAAYDLAGVQAWFERIRKVDERVEQTSFVVEPFSSINNSTIAAPRSTA